MKSPDFKMWPQMPLLQSYERDLCHPQDSYGCCFPHREHLRYVASWRDWGIWGVLLGAIGEAQLDFLELEVSLKPPYLEAPLSSPLSVTALCCHDSSLKSLDP